MKKPKKSIFDLSPFSERGFSSVVTFLVMAMVATIGFTLFFITMSDSNMTVRKLQATKAFYLSEGGLQYGMMRLNSGRAVDENQAIPIFNGIVHLDTSKAQEFTILTARAEFSGITRRTGLYLRNTVDLGAFALYSTGQVEEVTTLDDDGNPDPDLLVAEADSLPKIDYLGLTDRAINQGHVIYDPDFRPDDNYPNGDFYYSPDVPNVTHAVGDMTVQGGRTIYGLYVVEGNVSLHGGARLIGVLYLPNVDSEVLQITMTGGGTPTESSVLGGIVANGDIRGTGNHITIRYKEEYMWYFGEYERPSDTYWIVRWVEL